ncbi:spermatogenesis-associated protein 6-like isoform x2 protein [Lasius niger]|uniref:Spermatogenesis-associated protein 6-like isoform x2 protein n=1 Tax=Lasius niger TaxID=67767 RepID=A0A0J7KG62_LASNI|nr:spermatogenesis-associated protein 6-like isoform x2 protein [Lasius niger]
MAGSRAFRVKVHLDVHAGRFFCPPQSSQVTCPGVWLCPSGKVALRIDALDFCAESRRINPIFPLLFHDRFTFSKIFARTASLAELQRTLEREFLYAELIQWTTPAHRRGITLATFEINLADLLYPAPCFKGLLAGVDVDLLMEPTKCFPGIIAPKIEVSTKTIVEEVSGSCDTSMSKCYVVDPKMINSKETTCGERRRPVKGIIRQRRVCHTKPRSQSCRPLQSKIRNLQKAREKLCVTEPMMDIEESDPSCEYTRDHSRGYEFYKDLEKFYKRMYKQAKLCAREVDG